MGCLGGDGLLQRQWILYKSPHRPHEHVLNVDHWSHLVSNLVAWEWGWVRIGEDSDTCDSEFLARGDDSTCNFSAICNQHFCYSGYSRTVGR